MKRLIPFKNPKTGETKTVKIGFSWVFFFWSGFLGLLLFLRGLNVWGGLFFGLWAINLLFDFNPNLQILFITIAMGLSFWIAAKGNEMVAKNYLEKGWLFAEPNSEPTKQAKAKWGIHLDNVPTDVISASPANINTTGAGNTKYCFKCGQKNPESALFCTSCGVSQGMTSETAI